MAERPDSIVRSAGVISALTLLSRMLGVVRDCVCAALFGAGVVWDAFSFAFRIPNLFRKLFGEGALSAAFVPAFTEQLERGQREDAWRLAGRVAGALAAVLAGLLLAGEAVLLPLLRWGHLSDRWQLAVALTALLLPYMVFICLTALAGAALNSLRHFAAPAAAPIVLNVCWIVAAAAVAPRVSPDPVVRIYVVAAAVLVAGLLQLALQVAVLRARGFRFMPSLRVFHPQVRALAATMAPVALGMAALQLNVLLDGVIAISLSGPPGAGTFRLAGATLSYPMQTGANSVLYYAARLMQLPLGVFGIAVATAIFPMLSRHATRQDWPAFTRTLWRGLGLVFFIGLPAGVGLALLRRPIVELVFQRGAFTPQMAARTARALLGYSLAVWAYCALHVLVRAFYSLKRPGTPAKVAAAMVAVNLGLNLTLVWPLAEAGLAAATAISAVVQVAILSALLFRRVPVGNVRPLAATVGKTVAATCLMAVACWGALLALPAAPADGALGLKLLRALGPASAGGIVFLAAAAAMRTRELSELLGQVRAAVSRKE